MGFVQKWKSGKAKAQRKVRLLRSKDADGNDKLRAEEKEAVARAGKLNEVMRICMHNVYVSVCVQVK